MKNRDKGKYVTDREEPLTGKLTIRVTKATEDRVKGIPDYAEKLREVIRQWLKNLDSTEP